MKRKIIQKYNNKYDFDKLALVNKKLQKYVFFSKYGISKIDFNNQ